MSVARSRMILAAITAAGAIGLSAAAAGAAPANGGTEHSSFPAAGSVFECSGPTGDITATSGTVNEIFHWNVDQQGVMHVTGTITPSHDVRLQDSNGDWYTISGASWFGGKAVSEDSPIVFTDTEHFVLHNVTSGGTVNVQIVSHMSPNGNFFMLDRGACEPPSD